MNFKLITFILFSFLLFSCNQSISPKSKNINPEIIKKYKNSGFALIYNDNLKDIKKLENRSLKIYHKSLKKKVSSKDN